MWVIGVGGWEDTARVLLREHIVREILDKGLEAKGLPQTQSLRIWIFQNLPELSERAFKENGKYKT